MLTLYARYRDDELRALQAHCLDFAPINTIRTPSILTDALTAKNVASAKTLPVQRTTVKPSSIPANPDIVNFLTH